ncbi:hypothetical protein [Corallococcus sp. CA047B]|uniref:hypothetical protein n=1 Tax=Corallococcus sp. CA047B TaxID=2316729 RepID=UPI0011C3E145|nr:hypothetical protein [Corallococcus sp. CA047B]
MLDLCAVVFLESGERELASLEFNVCRGVAVCGYFCVYEKVVKIVIDAVRDCMGADLDASGIGMNVCWFEVKGRCEV